MYNPLDLEDEFFDITPICDAEYGCLDLFLLAKGAVRELAETNKTTCGKSNGYICTRPKGHEGIHIALAGGEIVEIWGNRIHYMWDYGSGSKLVNKLCQSTES